MPYTVIGLDESVEQTVSLIQDGDKFRQNLLISQFKPFVAKTVSQVCKRYIREQDDEYSIGLIAFNEAIEKYTTEKGGSLLSFAQVIIKRKVIDFIRKEAKTKKSSHYTLSEDENQNSLIETQLSMEEYEVEREAKKRKEEMVLFKENLKPFNLSIKDLVKYSPKHADARKNAILVAIAITQNQELQNYLFEKKKLPINCLQNNVLVSRKTIERNRKYIIAMTIILTGDYLYLNDYLKGVLQT
ncbi:RNA polymerase sigma factor SigI [Bacillus carboniphilus]|uniref:RNA polymerase sigma factor SigI n=1 Tax=Bacillus carboniphilus TaxID=86663 RepID=A0ABY9JWF0_9BACI|nr:RNA polymerase sigma factor SigI [Bacillus carboniphilus]WLR43103.1 RNA polymerase sigma factor SigI [Bacillus carboniphilus]